MVVAPPPPEAKSLVRVTVPDSTAVTVSRVTPDDAGTGMSVPARTVTSHGPVAQSASFLL